jgi:hypothetical protein
MLATSWPRAAAIFATVMVAAAFATAFAFTGSASAWSCSSVIGWSARSPDSAGWVTHTWGEVKKSCDDGLVHLQGTIQDTRCDGRIAVTQVRWWKPDNPFPGASQFNRWAATAGCNTGIGFQMSAPGRAFNRVQVCTWAEDWFGLSTESCTGRMSIF